MPDAAWAVSVHPPSSSRKMGQLPVLTSSNPLSTLLQRFACARLSQSCRSKSCSDFSATFTTIAFDDSSLRWLEISTRLPTSKDLPSSLVQLRTAVWTGATRDTRPISDVSGVGPAVSGLQKWLSQPQYSDIARRPPGCQQCRLPGAWLGWTAMDFLVQQFTFLGIEFQPRMAIVVG